VTDTPLRAVIFDLDGVITDTAEYHYLGWQRLADEHDLPFDREANEELRGVSRRDSLLRLLGDREVDDATFDAMMTAKNGYYLEYLEEMTPRDALPGAVDLLLDCKRRGLKVAIGSSSKNAPLVLRKLGLGELFDAIADGTTVEKAKPAPDLFLAAAAMLDEPAEACVVVEDAGSGVDAALAAGMIAIGIGPHERVGHAHHRYDTPADVVLAEVVPPVEVRLGAGPLLQDGWVVVDDHHDPVQVPNVATRHVTGNGYLGVRGTLPEWDASATVGITVSDTYDNADGTWVELCNVPNALFARWEDEHGPIAVSAHEPISDRELLDRRIDLRYGRQLRTFAPAAGAIVSLGDERFASMDDLHLVAQRQRVQAAPGTRLTLTSGIDGDVWSLHGDHFRSVEPQVEDDLLALHLVTTERALPMTVAHGVVVDGATVHASRVEHTGRRVLRVLDLEVGEAGSVVVEQLMTVVTGNDEDDPAGGAVRRVRAAIADGFEQLLVRHALAWDRLWDQVDVCIDGDPRDQAVLRFNLFHNIIATPMHTDHLPLGARGLSCQAYQGAAFWDQEVFNLPMWAHTVPEVARNLLRYRHRTLDGARRKAARLGYRGAYYAWISGDTGDELCPDFFFADVLTGRPIRNHFNVWQMHISPDIATTVDGYTRLAGDTELRHGEGAEILFEVARFLASFVHLKLTDDRYHLVRLLGPDEYHENVDDNVFSLEQTRVALRAALDVWDELETEAPDRLAALQASLELTVDERDSWRTVHDRLVTVEPDPETGIIEQFDGYLGLEDTTPGEVARRLQHPDEYWGWPNGVAVHTQVIKQADVVQLFVNQPERYSREVMAANHAYYLPRTAHNSSLSQPMYALVAARLGDVDLAEQLFLEGGSVDLLATAHAAPGGTFIGGIHTAACGATWQVAVLGFGGVHVRDDHVQLDPLLPERWEGLRFPLTVRGARMRVVVTHDGVTVAASDDNHGPVALRVWGEHDVEVAPGDEVVLRR
jgi:beta-phosphoglucomutase